MSRFRIESLLELARTHGLDLEPTRPDLDETGLDFTVVHAQDAAGTPWILRSPRRPELFETTLGEKRVLDLVRPYLKPAVPDFVVHTRELIAYPRLEGTAAMDLLPAAPSQPFLQSFAEALVALQRIAAPAIVVRSIDAERAALAKAMHSTRAELAPPERLWARWQRWLHDDSIWPQHLALVHGDLHPGHLLLGPSGVLWGILDWTEAAVSDPSIDLAMFYGCYGLTAFDAMLQRFAAAGGETSPTLRAHAIERWLAFPALGAEWALRTGNDVALGFARAEVAKARE